MAGEPRVTDDQVRPFQEMVASLARRYDGFQGAEYDDLFQEGQLAVFQALAKNQFPSKDIIAKRMRRWVSVCARHGLGGYFDGDKDKLTPRSRLDVEWIEHEL